MCDYMFYFGQYIAYIKIDQRKNIELFVDEVILGYDMKATITIDKYHGSNLQETDKAIFKASQF